jgi:dihydrofolate reductase
MRVGNTQNLTHIDKVCPSGTYFAENDRGTWTAVSIEPLQSPTADVDYAIVTYDKVE